MDIHRAYFEKILRGVDFRGGTYSGTPAAVYTELEYDIKKVLSEQGIECYFQGRSSFFESYGAKVITVVIPRGSVYDTLEVFAQKVGRRLCIDFFDGWRGPPCVCFEK